MKDGLFTSLLVGALTTASVTVGTVILPMMEVGNFDLYDPPDKLTITWEPNGYRDKYPYRAVFMGAHEDGFGSQGYAVQFYIVYSKQPVADVFTFAYQESREYWGQIRATAKDRSQFGAVVEDKDFAIERHSWDGIKSDGESFNTGIGFGTLVVSGPGPYYFDFDFYYPCCGELDVTGAQSIADVPYAYILTCGGGSQGGGSSGGGEDSSGGSSGGDGSSSGGEDSSGGSSGGDGSSSGGEDSSGGNSGGDGSSSGGEDSSGGSSGGDGSSSGGDGPQWPYDDDEPSGEASLGGGGVPGWTQDGDEYGDTWELPSFSDDNGVRGEAGGFQDLQPGSDEWGYEQWLPNADGWGLIDFGVYVDGGS